MSWVAVGYVAAGVVVAAAGYSANQSKQAAKGARYQAQQAMDKSAADAAKAESDAANEANALRVGQKRAFQANALALGGTDDSLGGAPMGATGTGTTRTVLSAGSPAISGSLGGSGGSSVTNSRAGSAITQDAMRGFSTPWTNARR